MQLSRTSSHHIQPDFHTCSTGAALPGERLHLRKYVRCAIDYLADHELPSPEFPRLLLIVQAALDAQALFFAAVLHDPTSQELDAFFTDFVTRCATPDEPAGTQ